MLAGDAVQMDIGRDAAVLIGTIKSPSHGNIKLPNLSFPVELAHGPILLTFTVSPHRSTETYGQATSRYETLRCCT